MQEMTGLSGVQVGRDLQRLTGLESTDEPAHAAGGSFELASLVGLDEVESFGNQVDDAYVVGGGDTLVRHGDEVLGVPPNIPLRGARDFDAQLGGRNFN